MMMTAAGTGAAGPGPGDGRGRGRAAGHRHRSASGRRGQRLRRPPGGGRGGAEPRAPVSSSCRSRPRQGEGGYAAEQGAEFLARQQAADRRHRRSLRRGDHHGRRPRSAGPPAGDRGNGRAHAAGLGDRRPGRRVRRQLRADRRRRGDRSRRSPGDRRRRPGLQRGRHRQHASTPATSPPSSELLVHDGRAAARTSTTTSWTPPASPPAASSVTTRPAICWRGPACDGRRRSTFSSSSSWPPSSASRSSPRCRASCTPR